MSILEALWLLWLSVWIVSALWTAGIRRLSIIRRDALGSRLLEIACAIPIALILVADARWLRIPLLPRGFIPLG